MACTEESIRMKTRPSNLLASLAFAVLIGALDPAAAAPDYEDAGTERLH